MKPHNKYALACALLMTSTLSISASEQKKAEIIDCSTVNSQLVEAIQESPHQILEIVSQSIAANETCAGEIVKIAIEQTKADRELVAQIVETAIAAAPKQIGEIATFAIATAPDTSSAVIAVIQKFNTENGTGQALGFDPGLIDPKGSDLTLIDPKAGIGAPAEPTGVNPLDFPSGPTQLFVDPKAGAAAPGVGAPGAPVAGVVENNTPPNPVEPPTATPPTPPTPTTPPIVTVQTVSQ